MCCWGAQLWPVLTAESVGGEAKLFRAQRCCRMNYKHMKRVFSSTASCASGLDAFPPPMFAGACPAGGCLLSLACDRRIITESGSIGGWAAHLAAPRVNCALRCTKHSMPSMALLLLSPPLIHGCLAAPLRKQA